MEKRIELCYKIQNIIQTLQSTRENIEEKIFPQIGLDLKIAIKKLM
ncbi:MAG: hypothetical protein ACTSPY_10920 [Candidatus Helarchaeota archaeon]